MTVGELVRLLMDADPSALVVVGLVEAHGQSSYYAAEYKTRAARVIRVRDDEDYSAVVLLADETDEVEPEALE